MHLQYAEPLQAAHRVQRPFRNAMPQPGQQFAATLSGGPEPAFPTAGVFAVEV